MMNKEQVEQLILNEFMAVPFHSLYFYLRRRPVSLAYGGTCSDKVLHLYSKLLELGVKVQLQTSYMNDVESHRLLLIKIGGIDYIADIGNGWPSIKMFPTNEDYTYCAFGVGFHSRIFDDHVKIYREIDGFKKLVVDVPTVVKDEALIMRDIECRFNKDNNGPFLDTVRFGQVVGDRYLYLKDKTLFVYAEEQGLEVISMDGLSLFEIIDQYFYFDTKGFMEKSIALL
ncbi:arylamine N-acetyltransferase [Halosquirtibacter xylanolyticus]|uniref:hypothetical protein n=1 Tax=Halosquirtibacter xylanolyticus TaxID=3374599 RepID=UPI00374926D5|nr:arylamine N-acetyltransferase [Prolixibacteraceae bacterium]